MNVVSTLRAQGPQSHTLIVQKPDTVYDRVLRSMAVLTERGLSQDKSWLGRHSLHQNAGILYQLFLNRTS